MPMINARKKFVESGIYHVYNRGVNKQPIFFDERDFHIFIGLLERYILGSSPDFSVNLKSYKGRIKILAFCLLENHVHLLVQQKDEKALSEFMHSLMTSYTMRINKRHSRVGHLFQGIYKARLIEDDEGLMKISHYIHKNPGEDKKDYLYYPYSSVGAYLGRTSEYSFVDSTIISGLIPADEYEEFLGSAQV